jgi:hypothetical protein
MMIRLVLATPVALGMLAVLLLSFNGQSAAGSPIIVDSTADSGAGSLRQAILDANANAGFDTITFDPATFPPAAPAVISPASALPAMTDPAGASVDGTGAGVVINGSALAAGEDGLVFQSSAGVALLDAAVKNLTIRDFPHWGIYMCGGDGTLPCIFDNLTNPVIDGVVLLNNGHHGANITGHTVTNATITNTVANNNGFHGFQINSCNGNVVNPVVTDNAVMGNAFHGVEVNSCEDVIDALVNGNSALSNVRNGIQINAAGNLMSPMVTDNVSSGNGDDGLVVNAAGNVIGAMIARNKVELNGRDGIYLNASGVLDEAQVSANLVRNNIDDGVFVRGVAAIATHIRAITGNVICGNVASGLDAPDAIPHNAEGNWWGTASGPAPIGTGNAVIDAGAGEVDFTPWIDTVTAFADPAVPGLASSLSFQYSDAAMTVFLGQGLSAGYPFTVSTDNGTVTSSRATGASVPESINAPDGTVEVLLTPADEGQATATIDGPCGLGALPGASIEIAVVAPTPTPSPSPTPTPTPSPTPTLTPTPTPIPGEEVVWGDANCSGEANPVDSLLTLRADAGLDANTGDCPPLGTEVDVLNASLHIWGDVDCSGSLSPVDSLKILRFDAGLSVAQEADCPAMGAAVTLLD